MQTNLLVFIFEMAAFVVLDSFVRYFFPSWTTKPEARMDGPWKVARPSRVYCFSTGFMFFSVFSSFAPACVDVVELGALKWNALIYLIAMDGLFVFGVKRSVLLWRNAEIRWTADEFQITGLDGKRECFRWEDWALVQGDMSHEVDIPGLRVHYVTRRSLSLDREWDGMAEFKADARIFAQRLKKPNLERFYDLLNQLDAENNPGSRTA